MQYELTDKLRNYDVFPKVLTQGKPAEIHIRSLGGRRAFKNGKEYKIVIGWYEGGNPKDFPASADYKTITAVWKDGDGFVFTHNFDKEGEYFLRILNDDERRIEQFSVYSVGADLVGRYPFKGDLHMHTTCSDGSQDPEVVCANYRKFGYDFTVISDHCRYYPSLRAIDCYKDADIDLAIIPGEEVHMPAAYGMKNDSHAVNFGGTYSVNALVEREEGVEMGYDPKYRSLDGKCPDVLPYQKWQDMMKERADKLEVPENLDAMPVAISIWVYEEIKKAGGLAIFAHPTWKANAFHCPEAFTDYMMEKKPFDAFEVLGGESYYEQNGFQTVRYYEEKAKGNILPIVGSTDSHSSHPTNRNSLICSTIVFTPENERTAIISAVKDLYSVAVDSISKEYRLVGDNRLVRYSRFLLDEYFPLHDDLCIEEGRAMKQYATGTADEKVEAAKTLTALKGRTLRMLKKYFDF